MGSIDVSRLESSLEVADFDPRWTVLYRGPRSIAPESSRLPEEPLVSEYPCSEVLMSERDGYIFLRLRTSITQVTGRPSTVASSIIHA
jgi:hypothetical protein